MLFLRCVFSSRHFISHIRVLPSFWLCCVHDARRRSFHLIFRLFSFSIVVLFCCCCFFSCWFFDTHAHIRFLAISVVRSLFLYSFGIHLSNRHRWVCLFRPTHYSRGRYGRECATWVSWWFVVQLGFSRFRNGPLFVCGDWISMEINCRDPNRNFIPPHIHIIEIFIIIENYANLFI